MTDINEGSIQPNSNGRDMLLARQNQFVEPFLRRSSIQRGGSIRVQSDWLQQHWDSKPNFCDQPKLDT